MQTPDIKKLLQRKKFAGAELGKIILQDKAQEMERWKYQTPPKPPLFTNEELQQMKQGLRTDQDRLVYNEYAHIYNLTTNLWNSSMFHFNKVFMFYWVYVEKLHKIKDTEAAFWKLEDCPVVITKKEYDALKAPIEAKKRKLKRSPAEYMRYLLNTYYGDYCKNGGEHLTKEEKQAFAKLKKQKCTNKRILENFAIDTDRTHYEDAAGRTVDLGKPKTWEEVLECDTKNPDSAFYGLTIDELKERIYNLKLNRQKEEDIIGHKPSQKPTLEEEKDAAEFAENFFKQTFEQRKGSAFGMYLESEHPEKLEELLANIDMEGAGIDDISLALNSKEGAMHAYLHTKLVPDPVKALSKFEALEDFDRYFEGHTVEDKSMTAEAKLKEFAKDYPEIYKMLLAEIEEALPATKGMSFAKLVKPLASVEALEGTHIDWLEYIADVEEVELVEAYKSDTYEGRSKRARVLNVGFAVTNDPNAKDPVEMAIEAEMLDDIMANKNQSRQILEHYKKTTEDLFRQLHAHNALLGIICKLYDMPFLYESASFPLGTFKKFGILNDIGNFAMSDVYSSLYGNWEQMKAKAAFLKELYPSTIFDAESKEYDPDEALVQKVEEKLANAQHTQQALQLLEYGLKLLPEILGTAEGVSK